jgi:hypothetical protein
MDESDGVIREKKDECTISFAFFVMLAIGKSWPE